MLKVRAVCGDDVAYSGSRIGGGHHVDRFRLDVQNEATRIWTFHLVNLDDLAVRDSAYDLGAENPALQEAFQRMLMPVDASLCRSPAQNWM